MTKSDFPIQINSAREVNLDYHHGGLMPAVGAQSFQVLRCSRENADEADGFGWTYNHAPMLAHWNSGFYLEYLSNPVKEHVAPGHSMLVRSPDGRNWDKPVEVFPVYEIHHEPDPWPDEIERRIPTHAIMHQRMGFHISRDNRLLVLGFYGFSPEPTVLPFDLHGIGRVVREVMPDGSLGPIFFLRYNRHAGWHESNTNYPYYTSASDPGFVQACEEILSDRLITQQWKEEHGDADNLIALKGRYKAFSYYTLPDSRVVGLWKWSLAGVTSDRGETWDWVGEVNSIENAGAKIWGQATSDGRFALVYNPSTNNKHRWPLAVVTSDDGLSFDDMLVVAGDVPPRRYLGGVFKDFGQNYVRGIREGNGSPPDGALWVAYSMNKEDIWVTKIPVPIRGSFEGPVDDKFSVGDPDGTIRNWNLYSPKWSAIDIADGPGNSKCMVITDTDPHDHARAERVFEQSRDVSIECRIMVKNITSKPLYVEVLNEMGHAPVRMLFNPTGKLLLAHGRRTEEVAEYSTQCWYDVGIHVMTDRHRFELTVNGRLIGVDQDYQGEKPRDATWYFRTPAREVCRFVLRTESETDVPRLDDVVHEGNDVANPSARREASTYFVERVTIRSDGGDRA